MGRQKIYTPKQLEKKFDEWVRSISRTVEMTETIETGEFNERGKPIRKKLKVLNENGEPVKQREFIVPPQEGRLCAYLGISRATWWHYCNDAEFLNTTSRARDLFKSWLEEQLVTRDRTRGIEFQLQANYGARIRQEIELGPVAASAIRKESTLEEKKALLAELMADQDDDGR